MDSSDEDDKKIAAKARDTKMRHLDEVEPKKPSDDGKKKKASRVTAYYSA